MQTRYIEPANLNNANDWRPLYHFSSAAALTRVSHNWKRISDYNAEIVDGWRFSDNPESDWYQENVALRDPRKHDPVTGERLRLKVSAKYQERASKYKECIEHERFYRMRHIGEMELTSDVGLMFPPIIEGEDYCVKGGDILIRRVGKVSAALVSNQHRQHPVDANIAIVRGLPVRMAVWFSFCINQPLYRQYLEQQFATTSLVRVGLKLLRSLPLSSPPATFNELADQFASHYEGKASAEDRLFKLRQRVSNWVQKRLPDSGEPLSGVNKANGFFSQRDITSILSYPATAQARFSRELQETGGFILLENIAGIGRRSTQFGDKANNAPPSRARVLRIGDIDAQLRANWAAASDEHSWRYHSRKLERFDVMVSTFINSPRVGFVTQEVPEPIFPTEQLAVINFHHYPGAYALILELPMVQRQMEQLATGIVQRFVHPGQLAKLVVPVIDRETAMAWQQQLIDILTESEKHQSGMANVMKKMLPLFERAHSGAVYEKTDGVQAA